MTPTVAHTICVLVENARRRLLQASSQHADTFFCKTLGGEGLKGERWMMEREEGSWSRGGWG